MDPCSIFVENLPPNLTYGQIKGAFWPFQQTPSIQICKKEKYLIITFEEEETVKQIIRVKDHIRLKGHKVNIKQAWKQFKPTFIHIPPSVRLPPDVLVPLPTPPPPCVILLPPFSFLHQQHQHRQHLQHHQHLTSTLFLRDFRIFIISSSQLVYLFSCLLCFN